MSKEVKVGDSVKCIRVGHLNSAQGRNPPLRLNAIYVVNEINVCSCGTISYDVGLGSSDSRGTKCNCGNYASNKAIHYCNSKRFAKVETSTEEQSEIIDNSELVKELLTKQMYES